MAAWQPIDADRVRAAIAAAELQSSGQIVVSIARWFWGSVDKAADKAFVRLGVGNAKHHNGVLVFVVPSRKQFVVLGDQAVHDKVGQVFWDTTVAAISELFRNRDFTGGLVHGVEIIGTQLAAHFPRAPDDVNELSDQPDVR